MICGRLRAVPLHLLRHRPAPLMIWLSSYTASIDTQPILYTDTNKTLCGTEQQLIPCGPANTDAPLCDWTPVQPHGNIFSLSLSLSVLKCRITWCFFRLFIALSWAGAPLGFNFTAHSTAPFGNILFRDAFHCRARFGGKADTPLCNGDRMNGGDFALVNSQSVACKRPLVSHADILELSNKKCWVFFRNMNYATSACAPRDNDD